MSDRFLRKYASTQKVSLGDGLGASRMYTLPARCYPTRCVIAERREALRVTPRGRPFVDGLPRASSFRSRKIYLAEIDWYQGFEKVLLSRESFAQSTFCLIFEISGLRAAFVEGRETNTDIASKKC